MRELLALTAGIAADFVESLGDRPVFPDVTPEELREALGGPLPDDPLEAREVVTRLASVAGRGVVATGTGRYFGFVVGGALPAALAADWLTSAWDQNAGIYAVGPSASVVEEVTREWLVDLLGLPQGASAGFVTGTQMAHVTALAAARFHMLNAVGWDVGEAGLQGAPPIRVLAGAKRHVTVDRALRLLGLGAPSVVAADDQGRMKVDALRRALGKGVGPAIVCAQAGEINTGALDPLGEIADAAEAAGAWLHVDGAFGLWAAVSPQLHHLVAGAARADSWTLDAHKWLNVPYDSGIVLCAHPESHRAAMTVHADYLIQDEGEQRVRDGVDWVPEFSRRARAFPVYAALRSLGRRGVVELVERCCVQARRFAERISAQAAVELLNDVALNQVLFRYRDDAQTEAVLAAVQQVARIWLSGTTWDGRKAIRLSVSNWQTGDNEIELAAAEFVTAAERTRESAGQDPAISK